MTEAARLHRSLCQAIGEMLRPYGFKKKGATFVRELAEVAHVIQVQKLRSDSNKLRFVFQLNCGVWSRELSVQQLRNTGQVPTSVYNCHEIWPTGRGDWRVSNDADMERALAEVQPVFLEDTMPLLARYETTDSLLELWRRRDRGFDLTFVEIVIAAREGRPTVYP